MTGIRKWINIITESDNYVILYRGDSTQIDAFDLNKTDMFALFGQGIYLTDNNRIAKDYTAKASTNGDIIFRVTSAKSKQDVIDRWIRNKSKWIDLNGKLVTGFETWGKNALPYSNGMDWSARTEETIPEYNKRIQYATAMWNELEPSVEVRKQVTGEYIIRKKSNNSQITKFKIPVSYINRCLVADDEISDDVLNVIVVLLKQYGDKSTATDLIQYVNKYKNYGVLDYQNNELGGDGYSPTFREVWVNISADSPLINNSKAQADLRQHLRDLNFTGIHYVGGITMGGGTKHNAYVLWDDVFVNKCIIS